MASRPRPAAPDLACFSESYAEAREKFLDAAAAAGAKVHSLEVVKDDTGDYMMDVAVVQGTGAGLVVTSSGTHGVEGYAGSAIQVSILRQLVEKRVSAGPTLVMVHAVNPYGMAHFRRWNENNVDLNRNALLPQHFDALIRKDKLLNIYLKFDSIFNPPAPPGWLYLHIGSWLHLGWSILRHGLKLLKTALVGATYTQTKGVFFGGQELQRSHVLLKAFMTEHFSHVRAADVGWVDIHTGLGPCGVDVLLGGAHMKDEFQRLFPAVPGQFDGFQSFTTRTTDDIIKQRCGNPEVDSSGTVTQSSGYEFSVGVLGRAEWLNQFFKPESGSVLVVTQEFGTLSNIRVARALISENTGFHYDRANHKYWRTMTRDAFYVRKGAWKASVLRRGHDVFDKFVARVTPSAWS